TTSGDVFSPAITSIIGMIWGGLDQCMPTTRPGRDRPSWILVMGMPEVSEASTQSGPTTASIWRKISILSSSFSGTVSTTRSAPATQAARLSITVIAPALRSGRPSRVSAPAAISKPFGALARCPASASKAVTVSPARARVAAMPGPMVPRPMTAAFVMLCPCPPRFGSTRRLLEGRALGDLVPPGADAGKGGQLDREIQAAMDDGAEADIGQGDLGAGEPGLAGRALLQDLELGRQLLGIARPARRALGGGLLGLLEDPEIGAVQRGELPIHPALDL